MLRALVERGIRPDLVLGCSVGALNGAAYAADPTLAGIERLEDLWLRLAGPDVMPSASRLPSTLQLARRGEALHDNAGLRELIERILRATRFDELKVPFQCVATQLDPPAERWFSTGPLHEAILASAALPAVFPIVELNGHHYLDGGIAADIPFLRAAHLGAETIYVLQVGTLARPWQEPRRPIDVAIQSHWLSRRLRYDRDLAELDPRCELVILPFDDPPRPRYDDFSHSAELVERAYVASAAHLDARAAGTPVVEAIGPLGVEPGSLPRVRP
jgi:NTE family protein